MIVFAVLHPLRFRRDHRFTQEQASSYLDGDLRADERARIESHAHRCPPCARLLAGLRRTVSALARLRGAGEPAVGISDGVLARLHAEPGFGSAGMPPPG